MRLIRMREPVPGAAVERSPGGRGPIADRYAVGRTGSGLIGREFGSLGVGLMSTNIVSIIPTDPFWVPGVEAAEVARAILARIYPGAPRGGAGLA
jgi:hypothetical protein